jgi:phosphopantetheinyl transferase (holo-ACP synthase)
LASICSRLIGLNGRSSGAPRWPSALKALGIGGLGLGEVEVSGGDRKPPVLRLHGRAAEVARDQGVELSVSLTHSRQTAAAVVLATPRG